MFSSKEQLKTIVAGQGGVGGGGERTDCIIGDSRTEDMRLVSDKSLWVLNHLELCHLLFKDWCLLPAMILRFYCKVLHWNLWPHLSGTMRFSFLQDNLLRRQGVQVKTRYPPNLDKTHRKHIMNFLKESGWVATWWRLRFFFRLCRGCVLQVRWTDV